VGLAAFGKRPEPGRGQSAVWSPKIFREVSNGP
jgi:hypothetical protein